MPRWGMAMEEGTIVAWHVGVGERVEPGDEVVDVESTKATNALEARSSGIVRRQLAATGSVLPVGSLLAIIAGPQIPDYEIDSFVSGFKQPAATAGEDSTLKVERVRAGSRHINCLIQGEGSTVVLIHGFGGSTQSWSLTQPALAAKHRVIAIDLPGHGDSDETLAEGSLAELAGAVELVFDALEIDAAHVIGHSLGGAVAIAALLMNPSRSRSLALIAPVGFGAEIDSSYIEGHLAARRRRDLRPHVERLFADRGRVSERMLEDMIRTKRIRGVEQALRQIAHQFFPGGRQRELGLRDAFAQLPIPRLLLWGDEDRIVPPSHGDAFGAIRIAGAGHLPQIERASETNRLILAHMAAVEGE
jgi:pyruvate dehydrogenase E2 component (dihydrolipoyllysine-residue acetyltransferase)